MWWQQEASLETGMSQEGTRVEGGQHRLSPSTVGGVCRSAEPQLLQVLPSGKCSPLLLVFPDNTLMS